MKERERRRKERVGREEEGRRGEKEAREECSCCGWVVGGVSKNGGSRGGRH